MTNRTAAPGGGSSSLTVGNSVTGGGANRILFEDGSQNLATSASLVYSPTGSVASGPQIEVGTGSTTSIGWKFGTLASGFSGIWCGGLTPTTANYAFASSTTNTYANVPSGGTFRILDNGATGILVATATRADWGVPVSISNADNALSRGGANQMVYSNGSTGTGGGTATSRAEVNKSVTAIADATPTATFTVTVPNAAHSAMLKVTLVGSLGAGGAIGANEASATISYDIAIARTAGVNAVATISSAYGSAATAVAGAATVTVTAAVSSISGAVGATNTFTVNVTITKSGGSSANHTCLCYGRLMNANTTGITIA